MVVQWGRTNKGHEEDEGVANLNDDRIDMTIKIKSDLFSSVRILLY